MIGAVSPYAVIVVIVLLIIAVGVLWLCRDAMRAGSEFEGGIGNRLLSMKIRTNPARADEPDEPDRQDRAA